MPDVEYVGYRFCDVCGREFAVERMCQSRKRCSPECSELFKIKKAVIGKKAIVYHKTCRVCNKTFDTKQLNHRVCSDACREAERAVLRKQYDICCDICGKVFVAKNPRAKRCSQACREFAKQYKDQNKKHVSTPSANGNHPQVTTISGITINVQNYITGGQNTWHKPGFTETLKRQVKNRDGWQCYICGAETNLHIHHIVPRVDGGEHKEENLVTLCAACHKSIESGNISKAVQGCVERAMNNLGF